MTDDGSLDWLRKELALLRRRIERLEANYQEVRRESMPPSMVYPKRKELEALDTRVGALERQIKMNGEAA